VLAEIEGLKGEELTSALVRFLLLRSQEFRERLITMISDGSKQGPLSSESRFSCEREIGTRDDDDRQGRVDLMIETDDAVIGLENKFYADFQEGQPAKYLPALRKRAEELGKLRSPTRYRSVLVILSPESRAKEVANLVAQQPAQAAKEYVPITWQDLSSKLADCEKDLDPQSAVIANVFRDYLRQALEFYPDFQKIFPHLRNAFPSSGGEFQWRLLRKIWEFVPYGGNLSSAGENHAGFYFSRGRLPNEHIGWIGFVRTSTYLGGKQEAEADLIVATTFPISFSTAFEPIKLQSDLFFGRSNRQRLHAWVVKFEASWDQTKWREELKPLRDTVETLMKETRT